MMVPINAHAPTNGHEDTVVQSYKDIQLGVGFMMFTSRGYVLGLKTGFQRGIFFEDTGPRKARIDPNCMVHPCATDIRLQYVKHVY